MDSISKSGSSKLPKKVETMKKNLRELNNGYLTRTKILVDAHHKRQVMGREVVVAITKGKLDFGPWEQIFYGEFDGRRPKRVLVKVIGE